MVFKTCTYCNKFEMDESTLHSSVNSKGTVIIYNLHKTCRLLKEQERIEKHSYIKKNWDENKKKKENIVKIIPESKKCSACNDNKHISDFYMSKDFTYSYICKKCQKQANEKWKSENTEKMKEYHKDYSKKYYQENKEKIDKYHSEYKKTDKYKEWQKQYYIKRKSKKTE